MPLWNVLVFPGGTEMGLEICSALKGCKEVNLISAGSDVSNHAPFVFPSHYPLPTVHEPGWIEALNALIAVRSIDFIIPAYDDVLLPLAENQDRIAAKVAGSPVETCRIALSKRRTYDTLNGVVPCPVVYKTREDVRHFPVFSKPDVGQGSKGTRVIRNESDLATVAPTDVLLEYLPGEEFTVDCFSDRRKGVLFAGGRKRVRVRDGISVATTGVEEPEFRQFADAIWSVLPFHGVWYFQVKRAADGTLKLMEVSPRVAGAMAFHRVLGVNFPLLSLYEAAGLPVGVMINPNLELQMDRALINRYRHNLQFNAVYVDLDETVVFRGLVYVELVSFLYQCVNSGIKLILLTKHPGDLQATLHRHRLQNLFDEIIHLRLDQDKADAIVRTDSIFIDDSYSYRRQVALRKGIPTFDLSMIDMLIDHTGLRLQR